jgi:uncharacterized membrane protein
MSTLERSRTASRVADPRPPRKATARLAVSGWLVMTLCSVYIVGVVGRYLTFDPDVYFPEQRETYLRLQFALGVHVICGVLALLIGPFQFARRLRRRFVRAHRVTGVVYVASATGLAASGLVLAPTAYTGPVAVTGFTLLGVGTLFTTWTAVRMVVAHRYAEHRRWMTLSFSLIWAGVMLRIWSPIYSLLAGIGLVHFSFETAYAGIAWLCWVPNLLFALWLTRRTVEREPAR